MEEKIPVLILQPVSSAVGEFCQQLGQDSRFEIVRVNSIYEAQRHLAQAQGGMVISSITSTDQIAQAFSLLRLLGHRAKQGWVRSLFISEIDEAPYRSILNSLGCTEILDAETSGKMLATKVQLHAKLLKNQILAERMNAPAEGQSKKLSVAQSDPILNLRTRFSSIELAAPLLLWSDCWILKGLSDVKKVMGTWIIKMIGPPPSEGRWVVLEGQETVSEFEKLWEWKPTQPEKDAYVREVGGWIFKGKKPFFEHLKWTFVSPDPILSFISSRQSFGDRFWLDHRERLNVCRNSHQSLSKLPLIRGKLEQVVKQSVNSKANSNEVVAKIKDDLSLAAFFAIEKEVTDLSPLRGPAADLKAPATLRPPSKDLLSAQKKSRIELPQDEKVQNPDYAALARGLGVAADGKKIKPADIFTKIETPRETHSVLNEGTDQKSQVLIWTHHLPEGIQGSFHSFSAKTGLLEVSLPDNRETRKWVEKFKNQSTGCYFSMPLSRGRIFFKADGVTIDFPVMRIAIPNRLYEVQRRRNFRAILNQEDGIQFTLSVSGEKEVKLNAACADLSSGGAGLLIDEKYSDIFHKGTFLHSVSFVVDGREIVGEAVVSHRRKTSSAPKGRQLKVGIEFLRMKPRDLQFIEYFVFELSREYFSRWIK